MDWQVGTTEVQLVELGSDDSKGVDQLTFALFELYSITNQVESVNPNPNWVLACLVSNHHPFM